MTDGDIISAQLDFFARNRSGCGFAARAAKNPELYEWRHQIVRPPMFDTLDQLIADAIDAEGVSTLTLVFPDIRTDAELDAFLPVLNRHAIYLHSAPDNASNRCYRFRAKVGEDESFVSGFGDFAYMPVTRRTPHTAIVMRVKPRPDYDWHLKPPEEGLVHVADMDMKGMRDKHLVGLWNNSFLTVRGLLGHPPDDESAAKTTFVIPLARAQQICLASEQ